jgi:hypothetical protein
MYHEPANIEIIRDTRESIKRSFDLVQSAREEVLRIHPIQISFSGALINVLKTMSTL